MIASTFLPVEIIEFYLPPFLFLLLCQDMVSLSSLPVLELTL